MHIDDMTLPQTNKHKKAESQWPALLLGWIFILVVLFGIVFMILHAKPERKLVCDPTLRRGVTLTQFGTCRRQ